MITVSAVSKLISEPPVFLESSKQKFFEFSALKCSNACFRIYPLILPSKRWNKTLEFVNTLQEYLTFGPFDRKLKRDGQSPGGEPAIYLRGLIFLNLE